MADEQTKSFPFRLVFFIVLCLAVLGAVWYAYYWYTATNAKIQEAELVITEAENYKALSSQIQAETRRCEGFIAQESGEFGEFEYCRRFINWTRANEVLNPQN